MIRLDKVLLLENLSVGIGAAKTYIDNRISDLSQATLEVMEEIDSSITSLEADMSKKGNCETLVFEEVEVSPELWEGDTTYSFYPYRAAVSCTGVTAEHIPDVVFRFEDAESMNYAGAAQSGEGIVHIYAKEKPDASIIIPTIEARKAVS